jgi:hypothetical protein
MAECPVNYDDGIDDPYGMEGWPLGDDPCDYFLVDDQYNHEQYLYLEIYATERLSLSLLVDVVAALRDHPGWGVTVNNIDRGVMLIFSDKVMVTGPVFARCKSIESVLRTARRNLGGTREWEQRQATKRKWRKVLDIRPPWWCVAVGIVVAALFALVFRFFGPARNADLIAVVAGATASLVLWAHFHRRAKRRRIVGEWYCEIGSEKRRIEIAEDQWAMVTAHGYEAAMKRTIDWKGRPPMLTLIYYHPNRDDSYQPLESFTLRMEGNTVGVWTTAYAFRFLSDDELQLAPPDTNFSAADATRHPVYRRRTEG